MNIVLRLLAAVALAGTIVPALLYLGGTLSKDSMQWTMLAATVLWFGAVPWIGRAARRAAQTPSAEQR